MSYKKKNPSIMELAIQSSWKFSAVAIVLILLISYVVIPTVFSSSALFKVLIPPLQSLSTLVASIFALVAIFKLIFNFIRDDEHKSQTKEVEKFIAAKKLNQSANANRKDDNDAVEPFLDKSTLLNNVEDQKIDDIYTNLQKEVPLQERWTLEFINSLDWKKFEDLCSFYFDEIGVRNQQTSLGADGGIDLILFENHSDEPSTIVQCKKWSNPVGVKLMREFLGAMHHNKVSKGIYFTTDSFNKEAILLAQENKIELVDGKVFVSKLKQLSLDAQKRIYDQITSGDFTTPTCVKCGSKMLLKKSGDRQFWGCSRYPRCKSTLNIKSQPKKVISSKNNLLY